jgi:hypothetical protein
MPEHAGHEGGDDPLPGFRDRLFLRGLDDRGDRHAAGAGGLASEAARAGREAVLENIGNRELSVEDGLYESHPAAGGLGLPPFPEERRADGAAGPALHAAGNFRTVWL